MSRICSKADLKDAVVKPIPAQSYKGKAVEPKLTIKYGNKKLKAGRDYVVTYYHNETRSSDQPGSSLQPYAVAKGIGIYTGTTMKIPFIIQ